jgi:hypothetical protein
MNSPLEEITLRVNTETALWLRRQEEIGNLDELLSQFAHISTQAEIDLRALANRAYTDPDAAEEYLKHLIQRNADMQKAYNR